MLTRSIALILGLAGPALLAAPSLAQDAPADSTAAPARSARAAVRVRPGYQLPPENSAGLYPVGGEPFFRANCGSCHEPAINGAESRTGMAKYSPEEMYDKIKLGSMWQYAVNMNEAQIFGVVRYLTGKSPVPNFALGPDPNMCAADTALQPGGPMWNGWSVDVSNNRYQANPGFAATDIPRIRIRRPKRLDYSASAFL